MFSFGAKKQLDDHDIALLAQINDKWGNFEKEVEETVGHLRAEYIKWRRRSRIAGVTVVIGMIIISGDEDGSTLELFHDVFGFSGWFTVLIAFSAIALVGWSFWVFWKWSSINREFNKLFNPLVFEKAFQVLGYDAEHTTSATVSQKEIVDLLDHSELITENRNRYQIDDMVMSTYDDRPLFMAELNVKYVTGSGKNRRVKKVFHGVFVSHTLPRELTGKTFITTESDKRGFGHTSWWRRIFNKHETPRETLLEWNDFENKLHVATTDETEARYILTTDIMANLYDWWTTRKGKIRVSFLNNRLYVIYPDKNVKIGSSTASLQSEDIKRYVLSVVRPMWHVKQLLESVDARLQSW